MDDRARGVVGRHGVHAAQQERMVREHEVRVPRERLVDDHRDRVERDEDPPHRLRGVPRDEPDGVPPLGGRRRVPGVDEVDDLAEGRLRHASQSFPAGADARPRKSSIDP